MMNRWSFERRLSFRLVSTVGIGFSAVFLLRDCFHSSYGLRRLGWLEEREGASHERAVFARRIGLRSVWPGILPIVIGRRCGLDNRRLLRNGNRLLDAINKNRPNRKILFQHRQVRPISGRNLSQLRQAERLGLIPRRRLHQIRQRQFG